jgi:hypothetical protein
MVFRAQTGRRRSLDLGRELRHCMWSIGKNAASLRKGVKSCREVRKIEGISLMRVDALNVNCIGLNGSDRCTA